MEKVLNWWTGFTEKVLIKIVNNFTTGNGIDIFLWCLLETFGFRRDRKTSVKGWDLDAAAVIRSFGKSTDQGARLIRVGRRKFCSRVSQPLSTGRGVDWSRRRLAHVVSVKSACASNLHHRSCNCSVFLTTNTKLNLHKRLMKIVKGKKLHVHKLSVLKGLLQFFLCQN